MSRRINLKHYVRLEKDFEFVCVAFEPSVKPFALQMPGWLRVGVGVDSAIMAFSTAEDLIKAYQLSLSIIGYSIPCAASIHLGRLKAKVAKSMKTDEMETFDKNMDELISSLENLEELNDSNALEDLIEDNIVKIESVEENEKKIGELKKKLEIKSKSSIVTSKEMREKYSYVDDRYGTYFMPIDDNTDDNCQSAMLNITLDMRFEEWTHEKQAVFLRELANELNVLASNLIPISAANGSTKLAILITNVINDQFPQISKKCVGLISDAKARDANSNNGNNNSHNSSFAQKWCLKPQDISTFVKKNHSGSSDEKENANINGGGLTRDEMWFIDKAKALRKILGKSLQNCSNEYRICAIIVLDNESQLKEFIKHDNYKSSKLLFHGTKINDLSSIYSNGFSDELIGYKTDKGWYGKGHYFSSFPQYCMPYCESNEFGQKTLLACYVNCQNIYDIDTDDCLKNPNAPYANDDSKLDDVKIDAQSRIEDFEKYNTHGKSLKQGYDTHYVRVTSHGKVLSRKDSQNGEYKFGLNMFDEYVLKEGKYALARYCIKFECVNRLIIWRDPQIDNFSNKLIVDELKRVGYNVYAANKTEDALMVVHNKINGESIGRDELKNEEKEKEKEKKKIYFITNGDEKCEDFIKKIRHEYNCKENVLIYQTGDDKDAKTFDQEQQKYGNYNNIFMTTATDDVDTWKCMVNLTLTE